MDKERIQIQGIPTVIWGNPSRRKIIAVHGSQSNKEDTPIAILAKEATAIGYQVISFDLPQHGERKNLKIPCHVKQCIKELNLIYDYVEKQADEIQFMGCSMGAYFGLLSYVDKTITKSYFLSPVVNMRKLIESMMSSFHISEEQLKREKEIQTPIGETLYWDYYEFVKAHPITEWNCETHILAGEYDEVSDPREVRKFADQFKCSIEVLEDAKHYFHTEREMNYFTNWIRKNL